MFQNRPGDADCGPLVIVGTGARAYREYALQSAVEATDRPTVVLTREAPTWQRSLAAECRVADLSDPAGVAGLCRGLGAVALLTWDETAVETTARVAELLGLPHMPVSAVVACRDKLATRQRLAAHAVPSARFEHVHAVADAARAADRMGFPVVLKPRGLAGSVGVALARGPDDLARAFADAVDASVPGLTHGAGLLVEEFLDGPELSVDSVIQEGVVTPVVVARKETGFAPYFEEVGHLVGPWRQEPWAEDLSRIVVDAHEALGVTHGVTHSEVKLTERGPHIIEVNCRLGGDLIPHLGKLATGIDLSTAAVRLALGTSPDLRPQRDGWAAVRFLYPPRDARVECLTVASRNHPPQWLDRIVLLAEPGAELRLPPRGCVPRHAAVVVTGDSAAECRDRLPRAAQLVDLSYTPLDGTRRVQSG